MMLALIADGEMLRSLTGQDHGPYFFDEAACPGHVASETDPKVCGRCGVHIDSLRPEDDQ